MKQYLIKLQSCPKGYTRDLDKAVTPAATIARVKQALRASGKNILAEVRRVDADRLGIPVYLGICGQHARAVMPTRKQMGKGASPDQAQASAIMELMERYAFFTFHADPPWAVTLTWREAQDRFGSKLIPIAQILRSVNDNLPAQAALELLDLLPWQFYPATDLTSGQVTWLPLEWFRMLGEFNGSSAGNTPEESLLQGLSELLERHVCAMVDAERPTLPTIDQNNLGDETLEALCAAFARNGVKLILKDMSLGTHMPTVGALAWDPATFPADSEIVFTAGTATSPAKAAIRAVTEVAQLAGDFCTHACYEASALPKFTHLEQCQWLLEGSVTALGSLPDISRDDIYEELQAAVNGLQPLQVYAIATTNAELGIPAHWLICPGLQFRERDQNQSLGLFVGRRLAETAEPELARTGLETLARIYPGAHFLPFFQGLLALREGNYASAGQLFATSIPLQPSVDAKAMAAFYFAYALTREHRWAEAVSPLKDALQLEPSLREAANLLGVCFFKLQNYAEAETVFDRALSIDKGSAMDLANRGLARKFQGKKQEAVHDLEAALELDSGLDFARTHLMELYGDEV